MLEPDRLLQVRPFEFNVVETERLVDVGMGDHIDGSDCSLQSSEGAVAHNTHTTTGRKYRVAHQVGDAPVPSPRGDNRDDSIQLYKKHTLSSPKKQQGSGEISLKNSLRLLDRQHVWW